MVGQGTQVNLSKMLTAQRIATPTVFNGFSREFKTGPWSALVQENASRAGNMLAGQYKEIVGGKKLSDNEMATAERAGLLEMRGGRAGLKNYELFRTDPDLWNKWALTKLAAAEGLDLSENSKGEFNKPQDFERAKEVLGPKIAQLFENKNANAAMSEFLTQWNKFTKERAYAAKVEQARKEGKWDVIESGGGSAGSLAQMNAAATDIGTSIGRHVDNLVNAVAPGISRAGKAIAGFTDEHPLLAGAGAVGAGAAGVVAAYKGYQLLTGATALHGAATAHQSAAGALMRAAGYLGGRGVLGGPAGLPGSTGKGSLWNRIGGWGGLAGGIMMGASAIALAEEAYAIWKSRQQADAPSGTTKRQLEEAAAPRSYGELATPAAGLTAALFFNPIAAAMIAGAVSWGQYVASTAEEFFRQQRVTDTLKDANGNDIPNPSAERERMTKEVDANGNPTGNIDSARRRGARSLPAPEDVIASIIEEQQRKIYDERERTGFAMGPPRPLAPAGTVYDPTTGTYVPLKGSRGEVGPVQGPPEETSWQRALRWLGQIGDAVNPIGRANAAEADGGGGLDRGGGLDVSGIIAEAASLLGTAMTGAADAVEAGAGTLSQSMQDSATGVSSSGGQLVGALQSITAQIAGIHISAPSIGGAAGGNTGSNALTMR